MGDYARIIVDAFVLRRGHGSAISSLDQALVLRWERSGVPLGVVLDAIEEAFRKRREPPSSLHDCARQVKAAFEKWAAGATTVHEESAAVPVPAVETGGQSRGQRVGVAAATMAQPNAAEALREHARAVARDRGRAVLERLADEVLRHFGDQASLEAIAADSLERAFVAVAWGALSDEERARCEQIARQAAPEGVSPRLSAVLVERARCEAVTALLGVGLPTHSR